MAGAAVHLRIASRESRLAFWQARYVQDRLRALGCTVEIQGMTTQGDRILDRTLALVGGKGLFVKELEQSLLAGQADVAVHSLKDVPMELPAGLELAAIVAREDPHDAWVSKDYASLEAVPRGALVGTASMRRHMLLARLRPDLVIKPLRGNLDTRLKRLDAGEYAGIVLAVAGLKRLGLEARIRHVFTSEALLPAPGQGALGLEIASRQCGVRVLLQKLHHVPTALRVAAERALSRALGGSCTIPLAGYADWQDARQTQLRLRAIWGQALGNDHPDSGQTAPTFKLHQAHMQAQVLTLADAEQLGLAVAYALLEQAA